MTFFTNAFATITSVVLAFTSLATPTTTNRIEFGIYSTNPEHYQLDNFSIHHYFTTWHPREDQQNREIIKKINSTVNNPNLNAKSGILTIEPWPVYNEGNDRVKLMRNIAAGGYTREIINLCTLIEKQAKTNITLRWGHEMDLYESSYYPWAISDTALYIRAYKKWVDTCRTYTSKVRFMWSPGGETGATRYYPGDKYVDYVGMSWYSYPAFEWYMYGNQILTFKQHMDWKYNNLKSLNKPIIAAEFGAAESGKTNVLQTLKNRETIERDYPLLSAIVLFSDHTPSWIPGKISTPDWRLDTQYLKTLK
jgi:beta-mannanase